MTQAHRASSLLLQSQLIPVDFSSAHFDFNQDANGIQYGDLIVPTGSSIYTMRPLEGKFDGGIAVEEATTNLATNPMLLDANSDGTADGWSIGAGGTGDALRTYIKTILPAKYIANGYAQRIEVTATGNSSDTYFVTTNIPVSSQTSYTLSGYVQSNIQNNGHMMIRFQDVSGNSLGDFSSPDVSSAYNSERLSVTAISPSGSAKANIYMRGFGNDIGRWAQVEGIQLEQNPFCTSFINGSRGFGFVEFDLSQYGLLDSTQGTISFWYMSTIGWTDISSNSHTESTTDNLITYGNPGTDGFLIRKARSATPIIKYESYDGTTQSINGNIQNKTNGVFHHVGISWGSNGRKLYLDGALVGTLAGNFNTPSNVFRIGRSNVSSSFGAPNGIFSDLRIDRAQLSDEEIIGIYISNSPLYNPYDYRSYSF